MLRAMFDTLGRNPDEDAAGWPGVPANGSSRVTVVERAEQHADPPLDPIVAAECVDLAETKDPLSDIHATRHFFWRKPDEPDPDITPMRVRDRCGLRHRGVHELGANPGVPDRRHFAAERHGATADDHAGRKYTH
ncbi:protein of unknown function [Burkholderia multivorans]